MRSALGGACRWQHSSVSREVSSPGMEMFVPPQQRPLGLSMDFSDACGAGVSSSSPLQGMEHGSWNRFLISSPQFAMAALAALLFASPPPLWLLLLRRQHVLLCESLDSPSVSVPGKSVLIYSVINRARECTGNAHLPVRQRELLPTAPSTPQKPSPGVAPAGLCLPG